MKLRNKKTGQVGNFIINKDHFECVDLDYVPEYRSLAELTEDWGDYEEPKGIWYVGELGEPLFADHLCDYDSKHLKKIGNYFETKEEAEKAIEKLKAWKRLKDKGFKITFVRDGGYVYLQADWGLLLGDFSDVELLFGRED